MKTMTKIGSAAFVTLVCFSSFLAAGLNPPPDGGYPGQNTAEGTDALASLTTGAGNTATGFSALYANTIGAYNTATGDYALLHNGVGDRNTATGSGALRQNTTGYLNTATGFGALLNNTTGVSNTATGTWALYTNTTGNSNTATGYQALDSNTIGGYNTANGYQALYRNTAARHNTANGYQALFNNTSDRSTATGAYALFANTSGAFNTADGYGALNRNIVGGENTAAGYGALFYNDSDDNSGFGTFALLFNTGGSNNSAFGWGALASNDRGSNNIALGFRAGLNLTTGDNNIDIGNAGIAGESNTIRIGTAGTQTATYVAGIFGATVMDGAPVLVDTNGHLGTAVSSARFKENIKPMDKASEAILSLKPVMFRYKTDGQGQPQFGLIAEDVAKVNPDLVVRDKEGKPYTVRYDQVNAMLLNEFLKEHKTVQELNSALQKQEAIIAQLKCDGANYQATISELKEAMETMVARFNDEDSKIQKVRAKIATPSPSGRTAGRIRRGGPAPELVAPNP